MPLHFEAQLSFSSPFHSTTYTRTGGFCPRSNPVFQRVARQNPPVLWLTESACSCPEQPLSATHGRQRYNTLDFANKVVCHETAGFIGFFLPGRLCPPLDSTRQGSAAAFGNHCQGSVSPLESSANRALSPLLETQSQRNLPSLWNPRCVLECVPTKKKELWAFIPKRTPGSIICYGDLQRVCRNQMTDILRRRKDTPSAALLCFDMVLTSAVPDGRGRWQRLP